MSGSSPTGQSRPVENARAASEVTLPEGWPDQADDGDGESASDGDSGTDGGDESSDPTAGGLPLVPAVPGGGLLVASLALAWWWVRGRDRASRVDESSAPSGAAGAAAGTTRDQPATEGILLARARSLLAEGDDEGAVANAYAAVRQTLTRTHGPPERQPTGSAPHPPGVRLTHREFEAAARAERDDEASGVFAPLAGADERLTFASRVSTEDATAAVEAARELVD